ncbi:ankyrin repeat domain-containing protein [Argonema antarcticum]|uniref:ankyrin repeat domain-containing protein n=1 Tax=Argonema antarcticum TaxID=2942763 RepID=UPI0020125138|nr:ankyrin repeat domain-containing protein [Argonema antarcticum]MCL1469256.1 ankyrin repeat domain-containing protein [Argonema antarcticum A004/B2]
MELLHQPGDIIAEKYRIIDTLGQGGSGTTYLAEDLQSAQRVALKALSLHRMTDWKKMELFEREARVLAQLNHPGIPRYLEYFHVDTPQDRSFYIAQQLAEEKSLAALVESGWRTDENGVRQIAIQILEILGYLHKLTPPVIHRDIKPQNIIRREDGQIFLVDFGAVQDTYHNTFMRGSTVVGTFGYMAPEQFRGQAVPTTDFYGLGATLLFLLTHRSPGDLPTDRLKIYFRSRVQISPQFADWLEKMLEPDVEDRFSSAKEALAVLQGKRIITGKARQSVSWKTIVGLGVAVIVSGSVLNYYKYVLLNSFGLTPTSVYEAVYKGDVDTVRRYLEQGGNVNAKNKYGNTLLLWAAQNNRKDVAELLIAKGADVNAKNKDGNTLLLWAAWYNWKEVAELLIAKGADVNAKNKDGYTLLLWAAQNNSKEVAELLIAKGADVNAKYNAKNKEGYTLLHWAAQNNSKDVAELLIAKGADVNAKDKDGRTPLLQAAWYNRKDVAELLIAKGADVNAKDKDGLTPLLQAAWYNRKDVAELLIAKGADVNAKSNYGYTPLYFAVKNNNTNVAELLIAKGADVNAKFRYGYYTPLHWAVENNNKNVAELLIAKGADVNAKEKDGYTPLVKAIGNNRKDIAELLKSHGAKE